MADFREIREAPDITDDIKEVARTVCDGWYDEGRIDWEDFLERMERYELDSGESLDFGDSLESPAITALKAYIRKYRKG